MLRTMWFAMDYVLDEKRKTQEKTTKKIVSGSCVNWGIQEKQRETKIKFEDGRYNRRQKKGLENSWP